MRGHSLPVRKSLSCQVILMMTMMTLMAYNLFLDLMFVMA